MSIAALPRRLPRVEDGPLAPAYVGRTRADWCEIETLLSAPQTFPAAADRRSSRLTPLFLAAAFVAIAVATAIPVARGWYPGGHDDGSDVAAQSAGQDVRQVAGSEASPNLAEGRSAAEASDQPAPAPIIRHRHKHRSAR